MLVDDYREPIVIEPPLSNEALRRTNDLNVEGSAARHRLKEFFRNYRLGTIYPYRDSLIRRWNRGEYCIEVDLWHLREYDEALYNSLLTSPNDIIPLFEAAAKESLKLFLTEQSVEQANQLSIPDFQVILSSKEKIQPIRTLSAAHVNKLLKVSGIIIGCSKIRSKTTLVTAKCTKCGCIKRLPCKNAMGGVNIPTVCDRDGQPGDDCGRDSYVIMADNCEFIDQQTLKMQECPEVVPTGEMPRSIMITVDRYLVDLVTPGTRVSILGISSLMNAHNKGSYNSGNAPICTSYLRAVGVQIASSGSGRVTTIFTPEEEETMQALARDPLIYEKIANSIAPQISGEYTKDLKKAIACLLFGGSRKTLPDGVKLRGDINVLLMGDPSTAKSQFLKFVEKVAPIGVYTSGKGSSAAGLTAAVTKDSKGEFYLEGGAMILADGGVICIDEFDKMRESDRVAIHEAMEQQTISIAKAGITTVLNSRTSVLAAANPIYGRYDDLKSVGENIDLMSTILSRFDCIFIIRDVRDEERDKKIARHVLGVHVNSGLDTMIQPDIDMITLRKFIGYCRDRCAPRLSDEAAAFISAQYTQIRHTVHESIRDIPGSQQVVPITIRQLEALIRISESLAKMRLSAEATIQDVDEALRLFKVSTLAASQSNPVLFGLNSGNNNDIKKAEDYVKRRVGIRMTINTKKLLEESLVQGYQDESIRRAIAGMIIKGELQELNQRKILKRIK